MTTTETLAATVPTHGHAHGSGLPHSHGGSTHNHAQSEARPHLHLAASASDGPAHFSPSFSILRTSLPVRLGFALFGAALIWAAFHWAIQ